MPEQRPQPPGRLGWRWKRTIGGAAAAALLLLVGGAIVNVAVAWGIALSFSGWLERDRELPADTFRSWRAEPPSHWPLLHVAAAGRWSFDVVIGKASHLEFDADDEVTKRESFIIYQWHLGWPMRAVQAEIWAEYVTDFESQPFVLARRFDGHPEPSLWHEGIGIDRGIHTLPIQPKLPGFIVNTLLCAMLLWLLITTPIAARRMLRRRRGQCEKCAYPIGLSPVCTECGAAVRRLRRSPHSCDAR